MLTLQLPDGTTISAAGDVQLAAAYGELVEGIEWEELAPFDEHTLMYQYLEFLAEVRAGTFPDHGITDSEGA
jgi:hypothetical protein